MKTSIQAGGAVINQLGKLCDKRPGSLKLFGLALNMGNAQFIHERSPSTALVLRNIGRGLDYGWNDNYKATANAVADAHIAALSPFLKFDPWVECHNEPPGWEDADTLAQNIERARRGNEWQVIVADRLHAAGFKHVLAYSFNVGGPHFETWQYLQDGVRACEALALHEYSRGLNIPEAGLTFRYRETYRQMPVKRPIMLTELGLGFDAGYQALTDMSGLLAYLDKLEAGYQQDDYMLAGQMWIWSSDSAQWSSWDVQADSQSDRFISWLGSGRLVVPPPLPVKEPPMSTQDEILAASWKSVHVTYNTKEVTAFVAKSRLLGLGGPYGDEYRRTDSASGKLIAGQVFLPGVILETFEGDWAMASIKPLDLMTALPWTKPVPIHAGPPPPTAARRLTSADMPPGYGFAVDPYVPQPGEVFYGLVQAGDFKVGVGTEFIITTLNAAGATQFGVPIVHAWDPGRQKFESPLSDGGGQAHVVLGHGSDYTPGTGVLDPDYLYITALPIDGADGSKWPTIHSDLVHFGEPGGHASGLFAFQLMVG